jgi:uncharacterized protein YdiU (UPF0061 family)
MRSACRRRALAAVTTGEPVWRETRCPGAVLTRVAASHIRVGTFQFFAARGDTDGAAPARRPRIARHYPDIAARATALSRPARGGRSARQAALVARWMLVGFIHGVMNTDNMAISGETIDYGPCAFMDAYDPATVFSSIDQGRYAYANQPRIALWNLARLAETCCRCSYHPAQPSRRAAPDRQAAMNATTTRRSRNCSSVLAKPYEEQPDLRRLCRAAAAGSTRAADVLRYVIRD